MGNEGLVGELLLFLLPDPVGRLCGTSQMLQKHYLQGLLGFCVGKFAIVDKEYDFVMECKPSLGSCQTLERSSSQKCHKCFLLSFYAYE